MLIDLFKKSKHRSVKPISGLVRLWIATFVLTAVVFCIYWPVTGFSFLNYDDQEYVTDNPHVHNGLSPTNIKWAFFSTHSANWHPLTWMSHMLDVQMFDMNPGMHHLSNLVIHMLNIILLFHVLSKMTGNVHASFLATAFFALHPLQVESVAWISERKNVLCTLFGMMTIWAYINYTRFHGLIRYLLVVVLFTLGLMAKPMLVTLPFVLLLIDYWPLGRLKDPLSFFRLFKEKAPLLVLTLFSCLITVIAQQNVDAIKQTEDFSVFIRIANALLSYVIYMAKMIWPTNLTAFYPHPGTDLSLWQVSGAFLILLAISVWVVRYREEYPHLLMGWMWYLGTLLPVIGLIQIGSQALADRYVYIPMIGLFIMVTWSIPFHRFRSAHLYPIVGVFFAFLMVRTGDQVRHWQNDTSLFTHMLNVTEKNFRGHFGMGFTLASQGLLDDAMDHYQAAIQLKPDHDRLYNNIGIVFLKQGKLLEAAAAFQKAIQLNDANPKAHNNLGVAMISAGNKPKAIYHFKKAIAFNPHYWEARQNLMKAGGELQK